MAIPLGRLQVDILPRQIDSKLRIDNSGVPIRIDMISPADSFR